MTRQERAWTALNHKEPDRVPLDIGGGYIVALVINAFKQFEALFCVPTAQKSQGDNPELVIVTSISIKACNSYSNYSTSTIIRRLKLRSQVHSSCGLTAARQKGGESANPKTR